GLRAGASAVGGCCRVTPEEIGRVAEHLRARDLD
ncbi:homocysteine S-methyltransferase family protein, partial [Segeticoccus rhizosphaerae]